MLETSQKGFKEGKVPNKSSISREAEQILFSDRFLCHFLYYYFGF